MPRRPPVAPGLPDRVIRSSRCSGDTLVLRWVDVGPGTLVPAEGQVLSIEADYGQGWHEAAWDDDADVEVRALHALRQGAHLWEVRWNAFSRAGDYRVVLLERPALRRVVGATIRLTDGRCTLP